MPQPVRHASSLAEPRWLCTSCCSNRETILNIIRYNNSQNKLEAADFRSNDQIQKRLRKEFEKIPDATYLGGRRGGHDDVLKRPANLMSSDTCAQALATVHQEPVVAYNQKSQIWTSDALYFGGGSPPTVWMWSRQTELLSHSAMRGAVGGGTRTFSFGTPGVGYVAHYRSKYI
jgi:hypothetical protein